MSYFSTPTCEACTYAGTLETPPEFCENDVEPGFDYCIEHVYLDPTAFDDDASDGWMFQ